MNERVFQLDHEADHLVDMLYDANWMRPRTGVGAKEDADFAMLEPPPVPNLLSFEANFRAIRGRDFPIPRPSDWPIMSRGMLEVLLRIGDFPHRAIACRMWDDTILDERERYAGDLPRPGAFIDDYVAIHLTTHVDAIDWQRSVYEPEPGLPDEPRIKRLVLRDDVAFPPLFRLSGFPRRLFVSAAARKALEEAKVVGVQFEPYDDGAGYVQRREEARSQS